MAQRRSPQRVSASSPVSSKVRSRKYPLRHPSAAKRALAFVHRIKRPTIDSHASRASASSSDTAVSVRPILATLQPNLRRLPSRQNFLYKTDMRNVGQGMDVPVGSKRKRVVSANENTHAHGRPKRFKPIIPHDLSDDGDTDDDDGASMDVDSQRRWSESDNSDPDTEDTESSDEYLINEAPPRKLLRLRKDQLVQLYNAAGLADDPESFTKPELVEAIVAARDDIASLPPSSPPGRPDSISSDYSSDDGNIAGDEETDIGAKYSAPFGLRRRATVNGVGNMGSRALKTRSLSMGQLNVLPCPDAALAEPRGKAGLNGVPRPRNTRTVSTRSSPTLHSSNSLPSPPATRHRAGKSSTERTGSRVSSTRSKGKVKQVEFDDDVQVQSLAPSVEESELTDLSELEKKVTATATSPRRLRSRDKANGDAATHPTRDPDATPRQIRGRPRVLREKEPEVDKDESMVDEEEVDELVSSPSPTPPPPQGRRTPVKRRLRPRRTQMRQPASDDGGEGDDEGEAEEVVSEHDPEEDMEDEVDDDSQLGDEDDDYVENRMSVCECQPRKLRSGKVVGGEDLHEETEEEEQERDSEEQDGQEDEEIDLEAESVDLEGDAEEDFDEEGDEALDDNDFDLTLATKKSLVRLRRNDLVRLCETRDLDIAGTKPQLAQSLLQWRDRHINGFSSPSSTGTVRPPSTLRVRGRRGTKSRSKSRSPPILMRSQRVHQDEPRTPPVSNEHANQPEAELELDLESLGLEDREIPPDKLTKLEKIGSGGFKDVYIGRFKGRRVAIAEFRDQLSSMDIKELKLLGGFDHPNIVRFLGVSLPENPREAPVMIVSELCANGDLFDYVRNVPAPSLYKVLNIMLDIARGLDYLHMRKPSVIHRDCKSSNILITSRGIAKIADFGLAKVKQSTRSMVRSLVGTVNWQAPELWHAHPKYNHKVDVFSCAMVYWEILQWHVPNKKFPWEGMNEHAIYEVVGAKRQRPTINGLRKQWCPEILDLIEKMWAQDPADRPTMTEVVAELEHLVSSYHRASSVQQPSTPVGNRRFLRRSLQVAKYTSYFALSAAVGVLAIGAGIFIHDAFTYTDKHIDRVPVSPLALHPERGGPKNLPIVSALLGDEEDEEARKLNEKPKLVIVGGGWGTISTLQTLLPGEYHVTIVAPETFTTFTPLLPSAAVGTVQIRSLIEPLRKIIARLHGQMIHGKAVDLAMSERLLEVEVLDSCGHPQRIYVPYDKLVIGCGSVSSTHGVQGLENCFQLKTISDAQAIRRRIINNFEIASLPTTSPEERKRLLSFVVCGGGPTGVETAAEIYDLCQEDIMNYYPKICREDVSIHVIQSREHILNTYSEAISRYAEEKFRRDKVNLITSARVCKVYPDRVVYTIKGSDGKIATHEIPNNFALWSTGIAMNPFTQRVSNLLPNQVHKKAIVVDAYLRVRGAPPGEVYAVGDCATIETSAVDYLLELVDEADKDKDGKIDFDEFEFMVQRIKQRIPMSESHLDKVRILFDRYDSDADNSLSLNELCKLLEELGNRITALPPTAQVASQQGKYLGKKLNKLAAKREVLAANDVKDLDEAVSGPFRYRHLGSLAYIGNAAVFDLGNLSFMGGLVAMGVWGRDLSIL
ncbi:hypothetical protein ID866_7829 [Astraeus odoratus]|nr:hypothetical protein ID866_7829 [Astraeus odoratus]